MSSLGFERVDSDEVWRGRMIAIRRERFRHDDGEIVEREVAVHPGAAVVVAYDGEHVYLVAQPREAVGESALLELPAGKLDPGEQPLATARRELAEEIGKRAETWEELTRCYASPGFSDETYWIYLATDLEDASADAEGNERIVVEPVPVSALADVIERCRDAKTLVGLLLARDRLGGR